jgi:hypothetical protein
MLLKELCDNICAKSVRHTTVVLTPPLNLLFGICPKQITEQTGIRNICRTREPLDLLKGLQLWRQAPVHAQDLHKQKVSCSGQRQIKSVWNTKGIIIELCVLYTTRVWASTSRRMG